MKNFNFGYLLNQENHVQKITKETFKKPLEIQDHSIKFFLKLLSFCLYIHETTKDKRVKNYCVYFLTTGNAILQILRLARYSILIGYYGNVMILMRTIINYLNMSIYIRHHPEDSELLLKESRESFKENKEYKKKFHEFNLKKELERLGYRIPEQYDDLAKATHGSLWGAQVFGFKGLDTPMNEYELHYSATFSMLQSTTYLSFIISIPTDFAIYCLQFFHEVGIKVDKKLIVDYEDINHKVGAAIYAMEQNYQFIKNTPPEIQEALEKKIKEVKDENKY